MTTPKDARPPEETPKSPRGAGPFARERRRERRFALFLAAFVPLVVVAWLTMLGVPRGTVHTPHARMLLERGRSLAWAGTSQSAWTRLTKKVGGTTLEVRGAENENDVLAMNRRPFPSSAGDPASDIVVVGDLLDHPARRFLEALRDRYGSVPEGVEAAEPGDGRLAAFAFLRKTLEFEVPFPRLEAGLRFSTGPMPILGSTRVEAFGFEDGRGDPAALAQVLVHWQDNPADPESFVLELIPKGGDRVLLACGVVEETLDRQWNVVQRVASKPGTPLSARPFSRLGIPAVATGLRAERFNALLGDVGGGLRLDDFRQWLQVTLDGGTGSAAPAPAPPAPAGRGAEGPSFVFDEPFLLAVVEKDTRVPSVLLWIANPEMLVRAK